MATTDFTIADVLEWARTKPADERYNFCDARQCAIAQFGAATGRDYLGSVRSNGLRELGLLDVAVSLPWTFGGLAQRLEALCPETPVTKSDWARLDAYMADIELASA